MDIGGMSELLVRQARRLLAGGVSMDIPESNFGFSVSLLFLIFMGIMLLWEILIGFLSWVMSSWMHLKRVLVDRLKDELLALGVVSLVVAFVGKRLTQMEEDSNCPEGTDNLFSEKVITTSHYLLFWIAVTQIGYTLLGAVFTALRFHRVLHWEHAARTNQKVSSIKPRRLQKGGSNTLTVHPSSILGGSQTLPYGTYPVRQPSSTLGRYSINEPPPSQTAITHNPPVSRASTTMMDVEAQGGQHQHLQQSTTTNVQGGGGHAGKQSKLKHQLYRGWELFLGDITQDVYATLRKMLLLRVRADPHAQELRNVNLAVAAEQLMHKDVSFVHAHTWVQVLSISALMLYSQEAEQFIWANPIGLITLLIISIKLHVILHKAIKLIESAFPDDINTAGTITTGTPWITSSTPPHTNGISTTPFNRLSQAAPALPTPAPLGMPELGLKQPPLPTQHPHAANGTSKEPHAPSDDNTNATDSTPWVHNPHTRASPFATATAAAATAAVNTPPLHQSASPPAPLTLPGGSSASGTSSVVDSPRTLRSPGVGVAGPSTILGRGARKPRLFGMRTDSQAHVVHVAQLMTSLTMGRGNLHNMDSYDDVRSPSGAASRHHPPLPQLVSAGESTGTLSDALSPKGGWSVVARSLRMLRSFKRPAGGNGGGGGVGGGGGEATGQLVASGMRPLGASSVPMSVTYVQKSDQTQSDPDTRPKLLRLHSQMRRGGTSQSPALPPAASLRARENRGLATTSIGTPGTSRFIPALETIYAGEAYQDMMPAPPEHPPAPPVPAPPPAAPQGARPPSASSTAHLHTHTTDNTTPPLLSEPTVTHPDLLTITPIITGPLQFTTSGDASGSHGASSGLIGRRSTALTAFSSVIGWWNNRRASGGPPPSTRVFSLTAREETDSPSPDADGALPRTTTTTTNPTWAGIGTGTQVRYDEGHQPNTGVWGPQSSMFGVGGGKEGLGLRGEFNTSVLGTPMAANAPPAFTTTDFSRQTSTSDLMPTGVSYPAMWSIAPLTPKEGVHQGKGLCELERTETLHENPTVVAEVSTLEYKIKKLFWFGRPGLMLWLLELQCVCNASILTICFYYLAMFGRYGDGGEEQAQWIGMLSGLTVWNLVVAVYIGWVIFPQFALINTAVAISTTKMLHHLKWSNVVDEEEERGVAGVTSGVLNKCYWYIKQRKRRAVRMRQQRTRVARVSTNITANQQAAIAAANDPTRNTSTHRINVPGADGTDPTVPGVQHLMSHPGGGSLPLNGLGKTSLPLTATAPMDGTAGGLAAQKLREKAHLAAKKRLATAWMASLASRSGVILSSEFVTAAQTQLSRHAQLFLGLVAVWRHKALVQAGVMEAPESGYVVAGGVWLTAFWDAFDELDVNGSGLIHADELQEYLREAFNIRATQNEVKAMIWEVADRSRPRRFSATRNASSSSLPLTVAAANALNDAANAAANAAGALGAIPLKVISGAVTPLLGGTPTPTPSTPVESSVQTEEQSTGDRRFHRGSVDSLVTAKESQAGDGANDSCNAGALQRLGGHRVPLRRTSLVALTAVQRPTLNRISTGKLEAKQDGSGAAEGVGTGGTSGKTRKTAPHGVSFHNFVCFATFAFLDPMRKGFLEARIILDVLHHNSWMIDAREVEVMMLMALADGSPQLNAVQFLRVFDGVELEE